MRELVEHAISVSKVVELSIRISGMAATSEFIGRTAENDLKAIRADHESGCQGHIDQEKASPVIPNWHRHFISLA